MRLAELHYQFVNPQYLEEALRHSSFVNESPQQGLRDNERLEFLGDAVVNLVVSHLLMDRFPNIKEGELSRMRANLVNTHQLADLARGIDLGSHIQLGRGEALSLGAQKDSILADAFEAVMAAVYLDGGFLKALETLGRLFHQALETADPSTQDQDYKSRLQEFLQEQGQPPPVYEVVSEKGPDHDKTFLVQVAAGQLVQTGQGKNKKAAEQEAARHLLGRLIAT